MDLLYLFLSDFNSGGILMTIIFIVSVIAWMIGIRKWWFITNVYTARKKFLRVVEEFFRQARPAAKPIGFETYDRLYRQVRYAAGNGAIGSKGIMREFLIGTIPSLERQFSTMSAWISVAPLLGLLGTVMGMIQTFHVITDFGIGNPSLTAQGISVALLTTQAGLTAAFPAMIFHNYLIGRKNTLVAHMLNDCEQLVNRIAIAAETAKEDFSHV
ncbi:MAG: MotA/TolQ/ExbB proton channel family protein [Chitinispirillaceae bacterium]|nr:MotA/TolQ/ExbB proton channel family protein [Chitinispirillaceae bacterium]